jgi:hypothetical protein
VSSPSSTPAVTPAAAIPTPRDFAWAQEIVSVGIYNRKSSLGPKNSPCSGARNRAGGVTPSSLRWTGISRGCRSSCWAAAENSMNACLDAGDSSSVGFMEALWWW